MSTGMMEWGIRHKRYHGCGRRDTVQEDSLRGSRYRRKIVWDGNIFSPCLFIFSFHVFRESRVFILTIIFLLRLVNVLLGLCVIGCLQATFGEPAQPQCCSRQWLRGLLVPGLNPGLWHVLLLIPNPLDGLGVESFQVCRQNMAYL